MKHLVMSLAFISGLLSMSFANADDQVSSEDDIACQAGWAFELYKACENREKPIPAEGQDIEACGSEVVTLIDDSRCPAIYNKCSVKTDKVGNFRATSTKVYSTDWIDGSADDGQAQSWYCQQVVNYWNKHYKTDRTRAVAKKLRSDLQAERKRYGRGQYRYFCELEVQQGEYLSEVKQAEECGVAGYKECKVRVAKTCVDVKFAKEYEKDRREECGNEEVTRIGLVGKSFNNLLSEFNEGLRSATCLSCDTVSDKVEKAKCIVENFIEHDANLVEDARESYMANIQNVVSDLLSDDEISKALQGYTEMVLQGLQQ
ncbi:MAG: hypothetical protein KDD40_08550 [Bdellovibrionales bacterium]|nr:hypothetical protein [Bdellovibrionales bacterium]